MIIKDICPNCFKPKLSYTNIFAFCLHCNATYSTYGMTVNIRSHDYKFINLSSKIFQTERY